jgi:L-lactate dehydrogenase (cytochrome)
LAQSAIRAGLDGIRLVPHVLAGHEERDLRTTLFGHEAAAPVVVAPTALAGLVSFDGEARLARAARDVGIPVCLATGSVSTIEQVCADAPGSEIWFQLYVWQDRTLTRELVARAAACGVRTLVLTADTPVVGKRDYNARNGFGVPIRPSFRLLADLIAHMPWLLGVFARQVLAGGMPAYAHYPAALRGSVLGSPSSRPVQIDPSLGWEDVAELRRLWKGALVVKGILDPDDAERAVACGADGIVVSAHGGRNLDIAATPSEVLPRVAEAVRGRATVLADSGVRRGTDVLKYLHLGASAVLVGRLPLYGLAYGGEAGAKAALSMLCAEMDTAMTLLGVRRPQELAARMSFGVGRPSELAPGRA